MSLRSLRALIVLVLVGLATPSLARTRYCAVCEGPLAGLAAQRHIGTREVLVHPECAVHFDDEGPARYAAKVMPRAALFQEQVEMPMPATLWLYLSLYLLAGLVVGGATAYAAVDRGRSGKAWFGLGLVLNLAALAALLALPRRSQAFAAKGLAKVPTTHEPVPCPACGHLNHPASDRCLSCGAAHAPRAESEVAAARRTS
jgi:hypothetical protein